MKESVVSEKKAGSVSAQKAKKAASLTRDGLKVADRPLMSIVQRAGCRDCGPSVHSLAGGMMQISGVQRRAAAISLQSARGNSFVQRMAVQAKLTVGPADDEYEKEADTVADQVMSMPELGVQRSCPSCKEEKAMQRAPLAARITPLMQRLAYLEVIQTKPQPGRISNRIQKDPEEEEDIQTKLSVGAEGGMAGPELEQSLSQARGSGSPMEGGVRGKMENAFGADFSSVRIHSDVRADELSRSIQARAFTSGQDIFLRQGEYRPASSEGYRLLAHELTHVVQQTGAQKLRLSQNPLRNGHAQISKRSAAHIQRYYEGINQADPVAVTQYVRGLFGKWAGGLYPRSWRIQNSQGLLNETVTVRKDLVESLYYAYFPSGPNLIAPPVVGGGGPPVVIPAAVASTSSAEFGLSDVKPAYMKVSDFNASPQGKKYRFYAYWKTKPGVPLPNLIEGSQEYWFNYFWKEAQGNMTDQERVWVLEGWIENTGDWPVNTPAINGHASDAEKLNRMKLMVNKGMLKYGGDPLIDDLVGPSVLNLLAAGQEIRVGYRGEKWLTRTTAETVGKLPQVGDPARVTALHMNAPWHPYSIPDIANDCLFRKVNADNCLYTLTSIAKEFADATKFPFVQQMNFGDLEPVANANGDAVVACITRIRIFMVNASKMVIYDPTRLGATQWAGGEFAVRVIKPGEFLAELEVIRLHPRETPIAAPPIQTTDFNAECGHKYRVGNFTLMLGATSNSFIERLVRAKIALLQVPQTYNNVANDLTGNLAGIAF